MLRAWCYALIVAGILAVPCIGIYGSDWAFDRRAETGPEAKGRQLRTVLLMELSGGVAIAAAVRLWLLDRKHRNRG